MLIKIFVTGGTIDGLACELGDDIPKDHKSPISELLRQARVMLSRSIEELFHKDSRTISNEDRELIYKKCLKCDEDKILITHGAMTLPDTAVFLGKKNIPKTIVLVGAMVPDGQPKSDVMFNLGMAVGVVQLLPHGVFIAMNGRIFTWDNVKKNFEKGTFENEK
ncbi:MAG: asparaginase domain-containing protein [Candidatus Magasanikbacteria bacterium]